MSDDEMNEQYSNPDEWDLADGSEYDANPEDLVVYLDPYKNESDFTRTMASISETVMWAQYVFSIFWVPGLPGYMLMFFL